VTLEIPELRGRDEQLQVRVGKMFANQLKEMIDAVCPHKKGKALVIGLGNYHITPDALGPLTVQHIHVTRQYYELLGRDKRFDDGFREVSAIAPGVLGTTGIETGEIVSGIVAHVKPDFVLAVDSLASRSLERVHTTIQMADTGIQPGAGIGNKRKALNQETLGVPVIAIGVPTVVYASTIVNYSMNLISRHFRSLSGDSRPNMGVLEEVTDDERLELVKEVLQPLGHDLLVTPKDIDRFVEDMANLLASGMNDALHENMSLFTKK